MSKTKVLFLITKSNWGGAQRYVYDLATHLDRNQFDVVVAAGGDGVLFEQLHHTSIRTISIQSLTRDMSLQNEWSFAKELWQILKTEQPTVLHVNSSKAGGLGCFLGRLARVPRVIFTAHGWAFNEDRPWWQKPLIKVLHYLTVLLSHRTIAVSRAIVRQLNWPLAHHKMTVIYPGRAIGVMYGKTDARQKIIDASPALAAHRRDPWLVTIGELHPIKRQGVLISATKALLADHPKLRTIIIGEGEARAQLEAQIKAEGLADHVFLTGNITEAARFLRAADLFTLPSKSESYGYVLHEAGLAGVPVVASNVGGIPDIVIDGVSGRLVPPEDSTALATAIHHALSNQADTERFRDALATSMRSRTVEQMTIATAAVYSSTKTDGARVGTAIG